MKSIPSLLRNAALSALFAATLSHAATVSGTVTNKTTDKPAAGDTVVLVDVQAGMGEVAKTTTDARGHYSLKIPGTSNYLVRVTHQGSPYFIAAPQGGGPGDLTVYDVASRVEGVSIEADVLEMETDASQIRVLERYFVHNTSSPPTTQWSPRSFEIVLPPEAVIEAAQAQRPSGLPTAIQPDPGGTKGHYTFNFPIQPDEGEKDTQFHVRYSLPYNGKITFKAQVTLPADNIAVLLPKSMTFAAGSGADFRNVPQDPVVQTFIAKRVLPGTVAEYTISGTGTLPRDQQTASGGEDAAATTNKPGGGIGVPIGTPDPLSKYKWWILGVMALLLTAGAAFLLRRPVPAVATGTAPKTAAGATAFSAGPISTKDTLLLALKEELFALESEKLSGTIKPADYAKVKAALQTVLERALKRNS